MHFEGLAGAINVSIVAFSIVFGVLLVLTGTIFAMKLFAGSGEEKKNEVAKTTVKTAPAAPKAVAPVVTQVASADKTKIIAAITAAIVEFTGTQDFKILSVTPEFDAAGNVNTCVRPFSRWKTAGMLELNSNGLLRKWN